MPSTPTPSAAATEVAFEGFHLQAVPLTAQAFAPYGDIIDSADHQPLLINDGMTERYHALAHVQTSGPEDQALINLFHAKPYQLPMQLFSMERHPLGSQAFVPLDARPFIVVVAPAGDHLVEQELRAFITDGRQGVNYHRGVWHHSLIAPDTPARFLVVDRGGPGNNCDVLPIGGSSGVLLDIARG